MARKFVTLGVKKIIVKENIKQEAHSNKIAFLLHECCIKQATVSPTKLIESHLKRLLHEGDFIQQGAFRPTSAG